MQLLMRIRGGSNGVACERQCSTHQESPSLVLQCFPSCTASASWGQNMRRAVATRQCTACTCPQAHLQSLRHNAMGLSLYLA